MVDGRHRAGLIDRAFAILTAFGDRDRVLTLSTIARRSGLPLNTTSRIAQSLIGVGALERRDDGKYVVGLRLFEIATLAPRSHGLRQVAMPYLEDRHSVIKGHVLLTVREGEEAVLVERLSARGSGHVRYRVGGRVPLAGTGGGLVLLADAPRSVQDAAIAFPGGGGPLTVPASTTEAGDLRRRLAAIRAAIDAAQPPQSAPS